MSSSSVSSLISLLDDPKTERKVFALRELHKVVDEFWYEISEVIKKLKILHEDETFEQNKLAALLVSKVYFHLGSFKDSTRYALHAEELFDINSGTEYVETLLGNCIRNYIERKCTIDDDINKLNNLINRLFQRCFDCGEFQIALCLALHCRRLDKFKIALTASNNVREMLSYAYTMSTNLIQTRAFKTKVMRYLANMYQGMPTPDYFNWCQCLIFLDDDFAVEEMLSRLIENRNGKPEIRSYQLAFDLCESAPQKFLGRVTERLKLKESYYILYIGIIKSCLRKAKIECALNDLQKILTILSRKFSVGLHSLFLKCSNKTDMLILDKMMETQRDCVAPWGTCTAMVIANGFMYSGTTDDRFLRDNLQLLENATHWGETIVAASVGVINRGQIEGSLQLIENYKDLIVCESEYVKSGFLYALGLIHANLGGDVIDYLVDQLKNAESEEVRHGGCLGLGLAAIGTNREDLYQLLKSYLLLDETSTNGAASIAMGMVMLGSNNTSAIEDMVSYYVQESQHEKLSWALSIGIALVMYGRYEEADALIHQLEVSRYAILRHSAMYSLAMAYCGTGNIRVVRKFVQVVLSDVNSAVKYAAVKGLGFVLFKTPRQCLKVVSFLTKSYNPFVRYGATLALGIACAGTGMPEALVFLKHIIESDSLVVRQGAFIASAMILMQHNERTCPLVNFFRTSYADTIEDEDENEFGKYGAILAQGIIDAGGRNVTLSFQSRTGHTNMLSVVGTLIFTQFWWRSPMAHCLSLAFTPTCVIALNSDLKLSTLNFRSNVKPGLFAYHPPLEDQKEKKKIQVKEAALTDEKMAVDEELKDTNKMEIETQEEQLNSTFEILSNPARVLNDQLRFVSINEATRYVPVRDVSIGGIIMVRELEPPPTIADLENSPIPK